ncbi:putative integrase [Aporhodopirellula aestuarii]|uniref:ORF D-335-like domain-containing protein n=1 Tax=Aporhodopirellula aestuarii TaxID=2950107 RepID=A0ABT0U0V2_9BACT|nr:hypothetical protein [Aporhodopirellula aestuarii]MCM2370376.1 hypothetical protein [Aporhodopirellula aestuarii]
MLHNANMIIEQRLHQYFVYRAERVGKSIRKTYVGPMSDPLIEMLFRKERLDNASEAATQLRLDKEIIASEKIDDTITHLLDHASNWRVIAALLARTTNHETDQEKLVRKARLPGIREFRQTCRLSDKGDVEAMEQLEAWRNTCPEQLKAVTNLVELGLAQLLDALGDTDPAVRVLVKNQYEENASNLRTSLVGLEDHPIAELSADLVALAHLNAMRCGLAANRVIELTQTDKYWQKAFDRASKCFDNAKSRFRELERDLVKAKADTSS